jgi:hypothetical protein
MPKSASKKKLLLLISILRISGILIIEFLIYLILLWLNIWKIVTIPDKIFICIAAIGIAVLFGRKYESNKK